MKKMGMKGRLILIVVPVILAIMIVFFALSRKQIVKLATEKLNADSKMYQEDITGWVDQILSELQVYSDAIDDGVFQNDKQILTYLETSMGRNDAYPNGVYMGDDTGVYLDGSGWVPDDDWVLVERDWYLEGKDHDTIAFGAPYYDSLSKQMCVSASVRIQNSKATRVMAADVYLDYVCGLMQDIEKGIDGTAMLIDKDSQKILAHSDEALMDKALTDSDLDSLYGNISAYLSKESTDAVAVKGDAGTYYICVESISGTDWCLVTSVSQRKVLSDLHWLEFVMLLIALVAAAILTVCLIRVTNGVVRPVQQVTNGLSQVADGDFTHDVVVTGSDELAQMENSMQNFVENMREIIRELTKTSEWMNSQSRVNGIASANLLTSSQEQEEEMHILQAYAEGLIETSNEVSEKMTTLADVIHDTREEGTQARNLMEETAGASKAGQSALGDISVSMHKIETTTFSLADQIKETSDAIDKINGMVTLIMEITSQTNLLSLNASIEAARAGEAGRGFAVVAEEIGKLAVDSEQAATDIAKITQEIRDTMEKANFHMEESVTEVKSSTEKVNAASDTFRSVFDKVGEADSLVHHMVDMIAQVDTDASATVEMTDNQLEVAQEITVSVEKLQTCAQSVAENSNQVAESADVLEQQAQDLAQRMNQFQI